MYVGDLRTLLAHSVGVRYQTFQVATGAATHRGGGLPFSCQGAGGAPDYAGKSDRAGMTRTHLLYAANRRLALHYYRTTPLLP